MSQRPLLFSLILVGGMLAAGCTTEGSYRLAWMFANYEPAAAGCGAHGVDGVHITGGSMEGDSEDIVAVCSAGEIVRKRPVGRWDLVIHQVDVRGAAINVPDQRIPDVVIAEDAVFDVVPAVVLEARHQCADGVDNDRDGRLDIEDPDCEGYPADPMVTTE
jgi:hypothetical protein